MGHGFYDVANEYEGVVEHDKMMVDAMTVRMVNKPESMDTIVTTNREYFCPSKVTALRSDNVDILSDLAAALAGSIGIAPSSK